MTRLEFIVGATFTICLGVLVWFLTLPGSAWIEARVTVPNYIAGENPTVDYHRTIHRTFTGNFFVEIHRADGSPGQWCVGSGGRIYSTHEPKSLPLGLLDYTGAKSCDLAPGKYIITTCWTWQVLFVSKTYCAHSNTFTVASKP